MTNHPFSAMKGGDYVNLNDQKACKEHAFDSYCKKILKNEARDIYDEIKRQRMQELSLSELDAKTASQLSMMDDYAFEEQSFNVRGYDIAIRSGLLAESLAALPDQKRDILLLYHFLDMTDMEIGELLGMVRQTVQYQRTISIQKLRDMMEEYDDE